MQRAALSMMPIAALTLIWSLVSGALPLGHCHPEVYQVVAHQMANIIHTGYCADQKTGGA